MVSRAFDGRPPLMLSGPEFQMVVAVAWAGPVLTSQLERLLGTQPRSRTVRRRLFELQKRDLVRKHPVGVRSPDGRIPRYQGAAWIATERVYAMLVGHEIEPPRQTPPPVHQMDHDVQATEVLVRAVELSRPVMSGVYFAREQYPTDYAARPRIDSILMIRRGSMQPDHGTLPWLTAQLAPDEVDKVFAIEIDRSSEPYAVIFEKGIAYRTVTYNVAFREKNPRFPTPLWVVKTPARLEGVIRQWRAAWPEGRWIITTDEDLKHDRWQLISDGTRTTRSLLDGW